MYQHLTLTDFSPSFLLDIAHFFSEWEGTCLLYSGSSLDSAKFSFLGLFPFETITVYGQQIDHPSQCIKVNNPWEGLQDHFFASLADDPHAMAFGWFGYGMGAFADLDKPLPYRPSSIPDAYWQQCAVVLKVEHHLQQAEVQINLSALQKVETPAKKWIELFTTLKGWQRFIQTLFPPTSPSLTVPLSSPSRATYLDLIQQAQELIRAGEIYQVNLSQLFTFQSSRSPFSLFRQLVEQNPAPFSTYFRQNTTSIVCTSPERFLCKKNHELETRPIKGTIPRGKTKEEDQLLKERLLHSPKEKAELLMITDLMRNDLGKISQVGSVKTVDIWRCEAYTNVFHLISVIRSMVKPHLTPLEIVRSCFPGGSITGCPKLRAMEVIDDLEQRPRGIYTGSIGYFTGQGDFDLNIAIRTLVAENNLFSLQLGSGIVIDSTPHQEYQEILVKGESFFHILH